jgi:DNA-binding CsgD family transcriptional regulator/tetratricopeptide (TPR) repeat protein
MSADALPILAGSWPRCSRARPRARTRSAASDLRIGTERRQLRAYHPSMQLWERRPALDLLDQLLGDSRTDGRVALIGGEAGIGKSALVTEFARRCGDRARVLWGACDRLVTPRALGPLHDIGRQTGGALAERLGNAATQEELFTAFLDELATPMPRQRRPVVVVEDAHWADEATLDWLTFLGRRIGRLCALLVVTYRDDEVGPDHRLRRTLAALPSAVTSSVPIPALSQDCVLRQGRLAGLDGETVYRLAGGNPLLVTELVKGAGAASPAAVQNLILERLRLLPTPARDLAHLVSVVPTRADAELIDDPEAVEVAIDAGVLVPAGDGVSFRHELLRSTVEESLPPTRRTALHRRVLAALVAVPGVDPSRLVHHARLAGDAGAVLRFGRVAGAGAARQGAHREAAEHFRAAAAFADRLAEPDRADLFEQLGHEAYLAGRFEPAIDARRRAVVLREELGQPERMGENLRWLSRTLWWAGRRREARAAAARAVAVLESAPAGRELAMAYSTQAQLHLTAHHLDEAVAWAERAQELAERLGDTATAVHSAITTNVARAHVEPAALDALRDLHELAHREGFVEHAARALMNPVLMIGDELARYDDEAVALHEHALRYMHDHDLDGYFVHLLGSRARLRFERGDWAGALADVDAALAQPAGLGINLVLPLVVRGRIEAARGDAAAGATLDEAARHADGAEDAVMVAPVAEARSELLLWSGDAPGAQEVARRALREAVALAGAEFMIGRLAYRVWRAGGHDAVPAAAAEPYRWMIDGEWERAGAEWASRGATYLRAGALAAGNERAAGEALRILDGLGATRAAAFLRSELRKRGIVRVPRGPRPMTTANVAGLTPRQADVLALIAEGLSNAEIATRLTLSTKTVDHHISAVLSKLGVSSRREAAAAAHRLSLGGRPRQLGESSRGPGASSQGVD